jgi:hypothetical protein
MIFSGEQLFLLGVISSGIVFAINYLVKLGLKFQIGRGWLTVILFVVSIPLAFIFQPQVLPPLPVMVGDAVSITGNIVIYITELVTVLSQVVGVATAIYNIILKKVFEQIIPAQG